MYTLVTVLLFITCILLVLIVLVQNSKGGGLASNFQSSNQIMGVRKTSDFLEKATWVFYCCWRTETGQLAIRSTRSD